MSRSSQSQSGESKQLSEKLKVSEERFQKLYMTMTEGLCLHEMIYDEQGQAVNYRILDVNPAYEQIIGVQRDTIVGKTATEAYGTDTAPYLEGYAKVAKTGKSFSFETYFPPMEKHFRINVFRPQKNQFATVFEDVTERKHSEEQIAIFKQFAEASNQGFGMADLNGTTLYVNPALCEMLAISPDEILGKSFAPFYTEADQQKIQDVVIPAILKTGKWEGELQFKSKNGRNVITSESYFLIKDENGNPRFIADVISDVTAKKEKELRQFQIAALEKQAAIIDAITDAVVVLDMNGVHQSVNPSFLKLTQCSKKRTDRLQYC